MMLSENLTMRTDIELLLEGSSGVKDCVYVCVRAHICFKIDSI